MHINWKNIKLIISDFDGVMTDNRVWIDEDGKEFVCVSRADGQAINMLRSVGINVVVLSTETNGVVGKRAEKLKIECIQSVSNKTECLKKYCIQKKISLDNVAYVGNDVNDFDAMLLVAVKIAPFDASDEVKNIADYVTRTRGGYGVLREVASAIIENEDIQSEGV